MAKQEKVETAEAVGNPVVRQYYWGTRRWPFIFPKQDGLGEVITDDVGIVLMRRDRDGQAEPGAVEGELTIEWYTLDSYTSKHPQSRLVCYCDMWAVLGALAPELLPALANAGPNVAPADVVTILQSLGFVEGD